jgi:drug/metabolite transporter (DMT)-like permease
VNTANDEMKGRVSRLVANVSIAAVFAGMSYVVLWTMNSISTEVVFLLQIGFLLVAGIFLVRTLFDALTIVDKVTGVFVKRFGINEELSRERIFKDSIYIVAILLVAAALFPVLNGLPNFGSLPQEITRYVALGLILMFVYDIGRTFYRITEKKANSVANRISNSSNEEEKTDEK